MNRITLSFKILANSKKLAALPLCGIAALPELDSADENVDYETRLPVNALLTVIVFWLSTEFGLPAIYEHPRVEFVPPAKIASLYYRGFASRRLEAASSLPGQRVIMSVYDDAKKTIYLPEGWKGTTPAELSILVHEMVHHLQNLGKLKFTCPQEREQVAYEAQERWLRLLGGSLLHDFEIDRLTLLVTTKCAY